MQDQIDSNMVQNKAAWLVEARANPFTVKEAPYPKPGKGEIVLKNVAVAINPVENLIQHYDTIPMKHPTILGQDTAGEVVEVGPEVANFQVGDRVIAHMLGLLNGNPQHGGFQLYSLANTVLVSKIPNNVKFEQGVVLPLAVSTASHGLYDKDRLGFPFPTLNPKPTGKVLLVWGGSSSAGSCAIQLALASGYEVWATASKRNYEYCRDLGASQVFDYNSSSIVDDIVTALEGKALSGVYDAISIQETVDASVDILKRVKDSDKKLTLVSPAIDTNIPGIQASSIIAPLIVNSEVGTAVWHDYLPKALEQGKFVPKPDPQIVGTGLETIQAAVDKMLAGVSAAKLVVLLDS